MNLVEVDVVRPESLQARVDFVEDRLARETSPVWTRAHHPPDFRRDDDLFAASEFPKRAAGDLLACPKAVHVGRVEEVDAMLDGAPEERPRFVLFQSPLPTQSRSRHCRGGISVAHATEADSGDGESGVAESSVFHGGLPDERAGRTASGPDTRDLDNSGTQGIIYP